MTPGDAATAGCAFLCIFLFYFLFLETVSSPIQPVTWGAVLTLTIFGGGWDSVC